MPMKRRARQQRQQQLAAAAKASEAETNMQQRRFTRSMSLKTAALEEVGKSVDSKRRKSSRLSKVSVVDDQRSKNTVESEKPSSGVVRRSLRLKEEPSPRPAKSRKRVDKTDEDDGSLDDVRVLRSGKRLKKDEDKRTLSIKRADPKKSAQSREPEKELDNDDDDGGGVSSRPILDTRLAEKRLPHRLSETDSVFGPIVLPPSLLKMLLLDQHNLNQRNMIVSVPCHAATSISAIMSEYFEYETQKNKTGIDEDDLRELCLGMRLMFDDMAVHLLLNDAERHRFKLVVVATGRLYRQENRSRSIRDEWPISPATVYGGVFLLRMLSVLNQYASAENVIRTIRSTNVLKQFIPRLIKMLTRKPELCASEYVEI